LSDVVKYLREESVKRDPDKRGVNFIIYTHVDYMAPFSGVTIDPNTGLPMVSAPVEQVDLHRATVRVPALENVRLIDLIDAISKSCDQPTEYSVEEYAVVFSRKTEDAAQLFTRTFKVDPNTFLQGLDSLVAVPGPNESLIKFNDALPSTGKAANSSTNAPLDIQQKIRRFFEAAGVSFSLPSRNQLYFNDRSGLLMVRAALPELDIIEKAIEVLNTAPAQVMIEAKLVEIATEDYKILGLDRFLGNTTTNKMLAPPSTTGPVATVTGILTDPQFRVVTRALEQRSGSEVIAAPRMTTLSGRQGQITLNNGAVVFDCIPSVTPDGYTIQMTINFSFDESQNETGAANANRKANSTKHQLSTSAIVWDGQTMVLGGFPTVEKDKRSRKPGSKKMLLVFVTPTIIDPAGNPVHTADNRPFDPDYVPPQKSVRE
jgi:type II secretory pathway component GspD/PulD (secretin)